MSFFVDENSKILSNEVPLTSLDVTFDKEKSIINDTIFNTPVSIIINNDSNTKLNNSTIEEINLDINNNDNENENEKHEDKNDDKNDNDNENNDNSEQKEEEGVVEEEQQKKEEEEVEETEEEKQRRELEESERLAWELMQQEEQQFYQQQVEYMRQNSETFSAEDLAAMQQIVNEPATTVRFQQDDAEGNQDNEEEDDDDASENWDYDQLIALGQAIGDVKTERWRLRSKNVIDSLPVIDYIEILKNSSNNNNTVSVTSGNNVDSSDENDQSPDDQVSVKKIRINHVEDRCTVCMDNFDKDDKLNLLPCKHYFHMTCLQGWLSDHNSCPVCKRKVTCSP